MSVQNHVKIFFFLYSKNRHIHILTPHKQRIMSKFELLKKMFNISRTNVTVTALNGHKRAFLIQLLSNQFLTALDSSSLQSQKTKSAPPIRYLCFCLFLCMFLSVSLPFCLSLPTLLCLPLSHYLSLTLYFFTHISLCFY